MNKFNEARAKNIEDLKRSLKTLKTEKSSFFRWLLFTPTMKALQKACELSVQ